MLGNHLAAPASLSLDSIEFYVTAREDAPPSPSPPRTLPRRAFLRVLFVVRT